MPNPKMDLTEALKGLGFRTSPEALSAFVTHAPKNRLSPVEMMEQLTALERKEREARNLAIRTRLAALGKFKPLDRFDWNHPTKINRSLYEKLLTFDFIEKGHNVLFRGASGLGKTNLAQNLGLLALQRGCTVRFSTLADALAKLSRPDTLPAFERRLRHYTKPSLLIIDELGYIPADARGGDILYNIISRRHQESATIISTNLAFKQWGRSSRVPPAWPHSSTGSPKTVTSCTLRGSPGGRKTEARNPDGRNHAEI
jgi:DNA replication protein DnaC